MLHACVGMCIRVLQGSLFTAFADTASYPTLYRKAKPSPARSLLDNTLVRKLNRY